MLHMRPLMLTIRQAQEELRQRVEERTEQLSRTNAALQNEIALRQSEEKFRTVFEYTPVSLWEEDMSGAKRTIDRLRAEGVTDFRAYLAGHPEALRECVARVKVVNVNQATLDLLGVASKEALPDNLAFLLDLQGPDVFIEEFAALAEGKTQFTSEEVRHSLTGARINTILGISIAPGYEDTWGKVLVYVLDITERKRAEEALQASQAVQAAMIEAIPDLLFRIDRRGPICAYPAEQPAGTVPINWWGKHRRHPAATIVQMATTIPGAGDREPGRSSTLAVPAGLPFRGTLRSGPMKSSRSCATSLSARRRTKRCGPARLPAADHRRHPQPGLRQRPRRSLHPGEPGDG